MTLSALDQYWHFAASLLSYKLIPDTGKLYSMAEDSAIKARIDRGPVATCRCVDSNSSRSPDAVDQRDKKECDFRKMSNCLVDGRSLWQCPGFFWHLLSIMYLLYSQS